MFKYYWSKLIKKLPGSSIMNTKLERPSKIESRCTIIKFQKSIKLIFRIQ